MVSYALSATLLAATTVLAGPAVSPPEITAAPSPTAVQRGLNKRDSCTFSGDDGYSSASASKSDCATIVLDSLTVPSGVTLDLTDLEDGTKVIFEGTTSWDYGEWDGPLFAVSGTSIIVEGADDSELNGNGDQYWDGEGSDGGVTKPKFFQAHDLTDSTISNIKIVNSPVQVFSINGCDTLKVESVTIDNSDGGDNSDDDQGANTDCFDIGESTGVTITDATCYNQDDCVAINSGEDISFTGGYCSGGHGLSIGSVGGRDDNTVKSVTFESTQVVNSQQGIRIKAKSGDSGTISDITYKDITMSGLSDYGIVVRQDYDGDDATTGIPITDFTLDGISGTMADDSDYAIYIVCGDDACSDWSWSDVSVTGADNSCSNEPDGVDC